MSLTPARLKALADAAGLPRTGLERGSSGWRGAGRLTVHSFATVRWLVEEGFLRLYAKGTVAHATECGIRKWQEALEDAAA